MMVFWFVFWCTWVVSLVVGPYLVSSNGRALLRRVTKKTSVLPAPKSPTNLSPPAMAVYKNYMKLPIDSRPFPDIVAVLEGLDAATAYDIDKRAEHYDENYHMYRFMNRTDTQEYSRRIFPYKFTWKPSAGRNCRACNTRSGDNNECEFMTYYTLYKEINGILDHLAERERKQLQADNAHHLDTARELAAQLRQERKIQRDVTRELT